MRTQVQRKGLWSGATAGLVQKRVAFAGSPWHSGLYPGERCWSYDHALRAVTTKPGVGAEPQLHTTWGIRRSLHTLDRGAVGGAKPGEAVSPSTWHWPNKPPGILGQRWILWAFFKMEFLRILAITWGGFGDGGR